jgi:membrane-associated phospholipid phosphatase
VGRKHGALGWTYAVTLGFGLVYLGEHYVCDLLAGFALAYAVRRLEPTAWPVLRRAQLSFQRLEPRTS